jgi:hypothetical protein
LSWFLLRLIFIRFNGSFILSIVYGYELKVKDDPLVHIMERYLDQVNANLTPGVTVILETFPFRMSARAMMGCHYLSMVVLVLKLPSWFPGATFKQASLECLKATHDIKEIPFQMVKEKMVKCPIHRGVMN